MYETPKISVPVEVILVNNETITENMFLNEDDDCFFPFESTAGAYRLLNKHRSNPATWLLILQMTGQSTNWFIQRWLRNRVYPLSSAMIAISLPSTKMRRRSS